MSAAAVALVVGAGGQVGTELLRRVPSGFTPLGLTRAQLDVSDTQAVAEAVAAHRPAVVINASAFTAVDKAESERAAAMAINADGPANLARACKVAGIPLLHISTDYVFDGRPGPAWSEDMPTSPLSAYGESKLAGEVRAKGELDALYIIRTAWVFAAHGANFVKTMLRLGGERPELRVVDDQMGGPTPAAAIADALYLMARHALDGKGGAGTYHFAGAPATTWRRFAEAIFLMAVERGLLAKAPAVVPIATSDYPTPARRPANSVLDCGKIQAVFGVAQPDWRAGLADVLDELKGQGA